jgi:integrase/recombinase XerD
MSLLEQLKKEGLRRGLSPRTIKTYYACVNVFLRRHHYIPLHKLRKQHIEQYLDSMIEKGKPGNTLNVHLNAIKFFFEKVLKKKLTVHIEFSKTPKTLPEFLTKEEVLRVFAQIHNKKHLLMVKLLYAAGLRVSELTHLRVKDFEFSQNYGWVRRGKGNKDRPFILSKELKQELQEWINEHELHAGSWLFKGQRGHMSVKTLQVILKRASKKAKITKNVHPHTLRHSFATHLIQNGYAVTDVQSLLGHSRMETTMVYLHMASPRMLHVQSPLDGLRNEI